MKGIHGYYFLVPIITFAFWIIDIVGLLGLWAADGFPQYQNTEANIIFISDTGAKHKTFFIICSSLSAASYILTVFVERHLRHQRRIPGSLRPRQTRLDIASVIFAIIGAAALILLSVFDAFNHSTVHWSMTVVFVVGVGISVLLQILEIFSLSSSHESYLWHLKASAVVKAVILGIAVVVIIIFIGLYATCRGESRAPGDRCDKIVSGAGVCEWLMAFLLSFFFLTYTVDFWPAKRRADYGLTEKGDMVYDPARAAEHGEGHRPMAPYAIARDMGPNHEPAEYNTMTSSQAPTLNDHSMRAADGSNKINAAKAV